MKKISYEKAQIALEVLLSVICIVLLLFVFGIIPIEIKAQTINVVKREIVTRDTIEATNYVEVEEYTKKNGEKGYKATWCGRSINISKAAANDILEGSDAYVVLCHYNNGEVIRQKIITLYNN